MNHIHVPQFIGHTPEGTEVVFPEDSVTQGFAVLARRRSGKSVLAGVFEETLLARKQSFVVLDPVAAHWGIKYKTNENGLPNGSSNFRVMVVGGEHGDVPLDLHGGKLLAQTIVSTDVSVVVDLSLTGITERKRFVCDFADELYIRNSTPRCLILEEAHEFVPQTPRWDEQKAVLGSVSRLITGGGGRGLGFFLISQRPSLVNKDVLNMIDNLFVMRMMGPLDLKAIREWFEANVGDEQKLSEIVKSLPSLKPGDAWLCSPDWMKKLTLFKVRLRKTYHAGRTPKHGERKVQVAQFKLDKVVADFKQQLEATQAERQMEVKNLDVAKARIRVLEAEVKKAGKPAPKEILVTEKIVITNSEIKAVLIPMMAPYTQWLQETQKAMLNYKDQISAAFHKVGMELPAMPEPIKISDVKAKLKTPLPYVAPPIPDKFYVTKLKFQPDPPPTNGDRKLPPGAQRMLGVILARPSAGLGVVAALSGMKAGSGTFSTYLSMLRGAGLIDENSGLLTPTEKALTVVTIPAPDSCEQVLNMWTMKLGPGPSRILRYLVSLGGTTISKDILADVTDFAVSGTFGTYLSALRSAYLIKVENGGVQANREVFFF